MLVLLAVVFNSPTLSPLVFFVWLVNKWPLGTMFWQGAPFLNHSLGYTRKEEYVYDFEWNMDSWFMYVKSMYYFSEHWMRLRVWAESEIFHSLCTQCVLFNASTCDCEILPSLVFRNVIPVHYHMSTLIQVPRCLQLEFRIVKCVYLLVGTSSVLFFHRLLPHRGIWSIFLKNGTSIVFTSPSISVYLVCPANLFHFSSSKHDSNRFWTHLKAIKEARNNLKRMDWQSCFTNTTL